MATRRRAVSTGGTTGHDAAAQIDRVAIASQTGYASTRGYTDPHDRDAGWLTTGERIGTMPRQMKIGYRDRNGPGNRIGHKAANGTGHDPQHRGVVTHWGMAK